MSELDVVDAEKIETEESAPEAGSESSSEVEETEKQSKRDRGAEARIARLTAQYKAELESRDAKIDALSKQFELMAKPDADISPVETVDDLLKIIEDKIQTSIDSLFDEKLSKREQDNQQRQQQKDIQIKTEKFADNLLKEYVDEFDGDLFVGDDKTAAELKTMMQVFQSNPDLWLARIEKRGVSYLREFVRDEDKTAQKKEVVNKILEVAGKGKQTKNSGNNITENIPQRFNTAGSFLKSMLNKKE